MEIDVKQRLRDAIKSQGESISSVSKLIGAKHAFKTNKYGRSYSIKQYIAYY